MSDSRSGPPPVEPMSDLSWARVERGLWARLDGALPPVDVPARPRRWRWVAVPAAAAAAAALYLGTRAAAPPHAPIPARVDGAGSVAAGEPTRVTSGAAPSTIALGDAHVTLDADSAVVMSRDGTAVLERGGAWFAVAPRSRPFVVFAGDAVVRVVGTRFRVARFEERAAIEVERGLVDVTFQGITAQVGAGQRWSSARPAAAEPVPATDAPAPAPAEPAAPSSSAPTATRDRPARPASRPATHPAAARTAAPVLDAERREFERLTATEARDPDAALAGYLVLARGTGRWAEVALYAGGRLAADRGDGRASHLLSIYLRRFPRGANAADARTLLERLKGAP